MEQYKGNLDSINIYNEYRARNYILSDKHLRKILNQKGIITTQEIEEYDRQLELELQRQREERRKQREKFERMQYEKLKAKFEKMNGSVGNEKY